MTAFGCSEKEDEEADAKEDEETTSSIGVGGQPAPVGVSAESGSDVVGYALNALSSAAISDSASALALEGTRSAKHPRCSIHAEPWDEGTESRMQPSNPLFARTTFSCQLESGESSDAVRGAFQQNYSILCDIERVTGALEYTAAGKVYETTIQPSLACGWSQKSVDEIAEQAPTGIPATLTATSYASGDWTTSLSLQSAEADVDLIIYMHTSADQIAFKQVDTWSFEERGGDNPAILDEEATGFSGGTIQINTTTGTLHAETVDTYWGRRARMMVKGNFDPATGAFSQITEAEGLHGNFDISVYEEETGLYAELSSVKGNSTDGFYFQSAQFGCHSDSDCDPRTEVDSATVSNSANECYPSTAACDGNTGIALGVSAFWKLGAGFDDQEGSRTDVEAWLKDSGLLEFTTVSDTDAAL
jgi:hypothetical protein